jgi:Na+/H+ antiporter NhaD/arsenite permease-like protein
MRKIPVILGLVVLLVSFAQRLTLGAEVSNSVGPHDILVVSGTISNPQGKGIRTVILTFFANGEKVALSEEVVTSPAGTYEAELWFPQGTLSGKKVELEAAKPSYKSSGPLVLEDIVREKTDSKGNTYYLAHKSFTLKRAISPAFWIATLVLFGVYALIAFEVMHRTLAAFLGAALILFVTYTAGAFRPDYVILTFEDAMRAIDLNVIFLLMAMMIIVGVMKKTGVFQWLAYKSYAVARGNVFALAAILMLITAVISSFLDNVTTMLLIIPVTIEIALTLGINPLTLLLPETFASNVGGTATLIGDPPNIMIGSYANLTFIDFLGNLVVICLIGLAVSAVYFIYWYKKEYVKARAGNVQQVTQRLRDEYKITDKRLLAYCSIVLGITIFLFVIHGVLGMEPSIAAMTGAALLLVISRVDIVKMLEHEIEWPTLIFFMMLFIVVAAAEETGLIQIIADWVNEASRGSLALAVVIVIWVSALASAIIDNIPFTATMLPIVGYLSGVIPGAQSGVLWWALALGACLGGNGTMIGASANVVTVGMAERAGYHISFMEYLKVAFIPMIITVILCTVWLLVVKI